MKKIAIVFHSGNGHTKYIAEKVAEGTSKVKNTEVSLIELGKGTINWDLLKASDALIFGSPTYMGTVSAGFKTFMDESSKAWFGQEWAHKLSAGFTVSGSPSGDKLNTLQTLTTFAFQHGMLWVGYNRMPETYSGKKPDEARNRLGSFTGLMIQASNDAPEKSFVQGDLDSALDFGEKVATVLTQKFS